MQKTHGDHMAYPMSATVIKQIVDGYGFPEEYLGMTKREAFAMAAMTSIAATWIKGGIGNAHAKKIADQSIEIADALIQALNKPKE